MNDLAGHRPGTDSGLLSPVWSGTPVETATTDEAWLQAMLDAEAALSRAQAGLGVIPRAAAETITRQARAASLDLVGIARGAREAAKDSAAMLVCHRVLVRVESDLTVVAAALAGLACRFADTPMAGRTLAQHAVPTTLGAKAAVWLQLVLDETAEIVTRVLERRRLLDGTGSA